MAFEQLISSFDLKGYVKTETQRSGIDDTNGKYYSALRGLFAQSYLFLEEMWDVTHSLSPKVRKNNATFARTMGVLYSPYFTGLALASIVDLKPEFNPKGPQTPLDYYLTKFIALDIQSSGAQAAKPQNQGVSRASVFLGFTDRLLDSGTTSMDDSIKEVCFILGNNEAHSVPALKILMDHSLAIRPGVAAILSFPEDQDHIELHINRVSPDPLKQGVATSRDLSSLRKMQLPEHAKEKPVRGISWLIRPDTSRLLARAGFTPEAGVIREYYDIQALLRGEAISTHPSIGATQEEVLECGLRNILASRRNLVAFLEQGILPNVGAVLIPHDVFFHPAN